MGDDGCDVGANSGRSCPRCGCKEAYALRTRKLFKCKRCCHQFSATSGGPFHGRKLPIEAIEAALEMPEELSALEISRRLDVQYRTGWLLKRKMRRERA